MRTQTALLKEIGDCQDRITVELHRTVAGWQETKAKKDEAWGLPYGSKSRLGTTIAKAISDTTLEGWGGELRRGLKSCKKLAAAAKAGALPADDEELREVKRIARACRRP
jgi:hypothetical protein